MIYKLLVFIFYYSKFKSTENTLTLITGAIIFLPICFVDKPIHGIVMGVTMHYTQYLYLSLLLKSSSPLFLHSFLAIRDLQK